MIEPSLLASDFAHLAEEIRRLEEAGAQVLHLDIMDGHFVPNISFGFPVIEAIRRSTRLPLDVHLMISEPGRYLERFRKAGADLLIVHVEAAADPRPLLAEIRRLGAVAGLTLNPPTPIEAVEPYLDDCDLVLVMSVKAGFGGQEFEPQAVDRLRHLRAVGGNDLLLSVDGGVNDQTIGRVPRPARTCSSPARPCFHITITARRCTNSASLARRSRRTFRFDPMLRIVLIRPGATDYDCEERIQGTLDIPLNRQGLMEVARAVDQFRDKGIEAFYASPCESAVQTAEILAKDLGVRWKKLDRMQNLNLGLWQGLQVGDVRHKQPKVYRQWQEQPENVCPPDGEMIEQADQRIAAAMNKLLRRHKEGVIGLVIPEPLASVVRRHFKNDELGDLWKALAGHGRWEVLDLEPAQVPVLTD